MENLLHDNSKAPAVKCYMVRTPHYLIGLLVRPYCRQPKEDVSCEVEASFPVLFLETLNKSQLFLFFHPAYIFKLYCCVPLRKYNLQRLTDIFGYEIGP